MRLTPENKKALEAALQPIPQQRNVGDEISITDAAALLLEIWEPLVEMLEARGACDDCAYRVGSIANTCIVTVWDCTHQKENSDVFWCHHDMNEDGTPSKKCVGFCKDRKNGDD